MYRLKITPFVIFCIMSMPLKQLVGQNLFYNGSFEGYISPPVFPSSWLSCEKYNRYYVDINLLTPELIDTPYKGYGYVGLRATKLNTSNPKLNNAKANLAQELFSPLKIGTEYYFSIATKVPINELIIDSINYSDIPSIEVWLGDTICSQEMLLYKKTSAFSSNEWQEYSTKFIANSTYSWIYIKSHPDTQVNSFASYLLIDDVNLYPTQNDTFTKDCAFFIPTSFSPNFDGINDVFGMLYSNDCKPLSMNLKIFNRWGALIFSGDGINDNWNGICEGKILDPGTYIYQFTFINPITNNTEVKSGIVNLVK